MEEGRAERGGREGGREGPVEQGSSCKEKGTGTEGSWREGASL